MEPLQDTRGPFAQDAPTTGISQHVQSHSHSECSVPEPTEGHRN